MRTTSIFAILLGLFVVSVGCPCTVRAESASAPVDPATVQFLGKLPDGTMFLFDGRSLFQFTGTYRKIAMVVAASPDALRSKDGNIVHLQRDYDDSKLYVDVHRLWPDLQRKAAALGANAVIVTGEDIFREGFAGSQGISGEMTWFGEVTGDAVVFNGTSKAIEGPAQGPSTAASSPNPVAAQGQAPALSSISPEFEAQFPYPIEIHLDSPELPAGDVIVITSMKGDRPHLEVGGTYLVHGKYVLASTDEAILGVSITHQTERQAWIGVPPGGEPARRDPVDPAQRLRIRRGEGTFTLAIPMRYEGRFHVSFYPKSHGEALGGVYFAEK